MTEHRLISSKILRASAVTAALGLTVIALAGCGLSGGTAMPPAGDESVTAEEARDALVQSVDEAAVIAGGGGYVYEQDVAACPAPLPEGVQFYYAMYIPATSDSETTIQETAELWAGKGIPVTVSETGGSATYDPHLSEEASGPVRQITIYHHEAQGASPAQYQIGGVSQCAPGSPEDFGDFR